MSLFKEFANDLLKVSSREGRKQILKETVNKETYEKISMAGLGFSIVIISVIAILFIVNYDFIKILFKLH